MVDKVSILDVNNYKKELLHNNKQDYLKSYFRVINDYLKHIIDRIYGDYDNDYYIFIITRGLHTLKHIFLNLTTYTKNLDLVVHHSDKSTLYYVEFIEQIGNDNNSYLKLNSKDAALFIYKKTIFDINNEFRKNFVLSDSNKQILTLYEKSFGFINMLLEHLLHKYIIDISLLERKSDTFKKKISLNLDKEFKNIFKIMKHIYNNENIEENIQHISDVLYFGELLLSKNTTNIEIFTLCENFTKKRAKKQISKDKINKKMLSNEYNNKIDNPNKFTKWLFT